MMDAGQASRVPEAFGDAPDTRSRLLEAAERIFAERGIGQASLRRITAEAGANVAAVNYHFGSKAGLVEAVFARRIRPLNEERIRRLDELEAREEAPTVEAVLGCFLEPVRDLCARSEGPPILRLLARANLESSGEIHRAVFSQFIETGMRFHQALSLALPDLDPDEIFVRFRFLIGAMFFTYANVLDPAKLNVPAALRPSDGDVYEDLLAFVARGFAAPGRRKQK